jgi:hypothetical protein
VTELRTSKTMTAFITFLPLMCRLRFLTPWFQRRAPQMRGLWISMLREVSGTYVSIPVCDAACRRAAGERR